MTAAVENAGNGRLLILDDDKAVGETLGLVAARMRFEVRNRWPFR